MGVAKKTCARLQTSFLCRISRCQNQSGSAVVDTRSVARSYRAAVAFECRAQFGKAFHRGAAFDVFVGGKGHHFAANLYFDWQNLAVEVTRFDRCGGTLLAFDGKGVLLFARDVVRCRNVFGGDTHVANTKGIA